MAKKPGSGSVYNYSALKHININKPFLIAGGINKNNFTSVLSHLPFACGIDVATGIETDGVVDIFKINNFIS